MHTRTAGAGDLDLLVQFERAMLEDMASYGGMPLAGSATVEAELRQYIGSGLGSGERLLLLAVPEEMGAAPCGLVDASILVPEGFFAPVRMVHVHALYVEPARRKRGTGRLLLEAALEWGKRNGCREAELNVLAGNPARALYESLGFETFEINLRRSI